jgi:hypothetical protein
MVRRVYATVEGGDGAGAAFVRSRTGEHSMRPRVGCAPRVAESEWARASGRATAGVCSPPYVSGGRCSPGLLARAESGQMCSIPWPCGGAIERIWTNRGGGGGAVVLRRVLSRGTYCRDGGRRTGRVRRSRGARAAFGTHAGDRSRWPARRAMEIAVEACRGERSPGRGLSSGPQRAVWRAIGAALRVGGDSAAGHGCPSRRGSPASPHNRSMSAWTSPASPSSPLKRARA